ncbi:hypothetical protein ACU6U9_15715 [Pseudomonas sp. HK3]|jgi:hypothetical protein
MKSLTQIAYSCVSLILVLGCSLAYAQNMDDSLTQTSSKVTEVVIPLSGQDIKKNSAGPKRGMGMKQVETKYGKAIKVHPAKGKPPITRWDYPEFSVYFESNSVIHTVSRSD